VQMGDLDKMMICDHMFKLVLLGTTHIIRIFQQNLGPFFIIIIIMN
jgi:hypothetical protein